MSKPMKAQEPYRCFCGVTTYGPKAKATHMKEAHGCTMGYQNEGHRILRRKPQDRKEVTR